MSIQQYMGVIKATFCIVLVLNFVAAAASIEEKKTTQEEILSQLFVPASELLDYDTAEVLWMTCLEELIHLKRQIGDFGLCLPQESPSNTIKISLGVGSITRENIQKCIITCHPELEENFLQCLRKNNVPFHVSPEEGESENCLGSHSSRRYLADNGGSATKSNADKKSTKKESSKNTTMKRKDHKKALYDAIAKTALITFVAATLLFLCCCCCCRRRRVKQTDERPLLSMSINSDYSHGSSSGNTPFKNSLKEEKHGIQPPSNNLVGDKNSVQGNHVGVANTAARPSFELKPPPGRAGSGIPPLKPPPGRPDSLQRESQSVKPSDNSTALPPPLPPPAPPIATNDGPKPPPPPPKPGSSGPKPPPPSPPGAKCGGPGPPPPPKGGVGPPRAPPAFGQKGARPLPSAPKVGDSSESEADAPKAKLKPFFWDKVQANSDQSMVWNQLKAGSFQFDEEMMESLFGLSAPPSAADKNKGGQKKEASPHDPSPQFIQIVDKKKAQNLSILLRALNVTLDEVCDALLEGNEFPTEFLQTMLKMAPTPEEELKLRLYSGDILKLGPADRFLKALVDIPFAFKRMEALLYMGSLQEELTNTRESFATLEVACKVLRNSRLFLKLLEAVLKTGNRMNDGTFRGGALAFKLDTLLKLSDVKGVDGKTTLLHFVVQEIIRTEGIRSARMIKESSSFSSIKTEDLLEEVSQESEDHYRELGLQVVSHLSSELENVKKAAALDSDGLTGTTARLGHGLIKTRDFIAKEMNNVEIDKGFVETVKSFVEKAEADVKSLLEEEKKIMALVKSTGDYFHGSSGRDEGLRLFVIVRDFLIMLDKVCKEIQRAPKKPAARTIKQETPSSRGSSSSETRPPHPDFRQRLFPVVVDRRVDNSSSDEESP